MRSASAALVIGLLATGCAHAPPGVRTAAFDPIPRKVFFWSSIENVRSGVRFPEAFAQAFNKRFAEDLEACGSKVTSFSENGLELDMKAFSAAAQASEADTLVTFQKIKGQLDRGGKLAWADYAIEFGVSGEPGTPVARAADKGKRPVLSWKGQVQLSIVYPWTGFSGTPFEVQGSREADKVTNLLKTEGFYPGCPLLDIPNSSPVGGEGQSGKSQ